MDVTIRLATIADAAAIAQVHVASWRSTYADIVPQAYLDSLDITARTHSWSEQIVAARSNFLVAEDIDGVVGFICGGALCEPIPGYDAELYAIYLLQNRQGQGIGRRLTIALSNSLHAAGFIAMAVWVLERNPAVGFYERLGATHLARKQIEIGGATLDEIALGWPSLDASFTAVLPAEENAP